MLVRRTRQSDSRTRGVENALLKRIITTCCEVTPPTELITEPIRNLVREGEFRQNQRPNPSGHDSDQ